MRSTSVVSRPSWVNAMNALVGHRRRQPGSRRSRSSPTAASVVTRSPYAEFTGVRTGKLGRWTDGVATMRAGPPHVRLLLGRPQRPGAIRARATTRAEPETALGRPGRLDRAGARRARPAWRLRRPGPRPAQADHRPALARHQPLGLRLAHPRRPRRAGAAARRSSSPDLVTCGAGVNDILFSAPAKLFADLRALLAAVPDGTVLLDLPLLAGFWWIVGRMSVPYITRMNRVIHEVAAERNLPVAEVSAQFVAPWAGKFACDNFHPSQDGYRDWTRALLAAVPANSLAMS